jgi:hypothetical protein
MWIKRETTKKGVINNIKDLKKLPRSSAGRNCHWRRYRLGLRGFLYILRRLLG